MRSPRSLLAFALLTALPAGASPTDVADEAAVPAVRFELHGVADLRFIAAGTDRSWLDGGFGRSRYGGRDKDGDGLADESAVRLRAGQLSLVSEARVGDSLAGRLHLNLDTDLPDVHGAPLGRLGVVEAFARWSPVLSPSARLRLRAGITIPPFSLEHPDVAWSTRYTITPSAIGSWLGEEVKSTGLETTLVLATSLTTELQLQGGAFFTNDSNGALIAWRGWALHDRQGQTNDVLPLPRIIALTDPRFFIGQGTRTEPFREIDNRPGFHGQVRFRFGPEGLVQGGYYDSNGNVSRTDALGYTWKTRFALAGAELNLGPFTVLLQGLAGRTQMGFKSPALVNAPFRAGYVLVSFAANDELRLSVRYDRFRVEDEDVWKDGKDLNDDDGWGLTSALVFEPARHHRFTLEYVKVRADHPFAVTAGYPSRLTATQFQLAYRLSF